MTPSQIKSAVETCMKARLVPFIQSSPGMGKSSIVKQIAEEYGLKLIDCRLSTMEPTDLNGLPWFNQGKAQFQPYEFFPLEDSPLPEDCSGWLLFLDEFNSASRATQAAAYKVVLDREIGMHKLHSHCFVVAAGNKSSDNAITTQLSTAMLSRVIHLNMEISFEDWRNNFAIPEGIDERVIAYLSNYPTKLMEFDPERDDQTFTCPRTWEFVSKLIKASGGVVNSDSIPLLSGAITVEQASAFVQFCKVYKNMINIKDVERDPNIDIPKDSATQWAVITHLILHTDLNNYQQVFKFIEKFPATFKVIYYKSLVKRKEGFLKEPEFVKNISAIATYLLGEL